MKYTTYWDGEHILAIGSFCSKDYTVTLSIYIVWWHRRSAKKPLQQYQAFLLESSLMYSCLHCGSLWVCTNHLCGYNKSAVHIRYLVAYSAPSHLWSASPNSTINHHKMTCNTYCMGSIHFLWAEGAVGAESVWFCVCRHSGSNRPINTSHTYRPSHIHHHYVLYMGVWRQVGHWWVLNEKKSIVSKVTLCGLVFIFLFSFLVIFT